MTEKIYKFPALKLINTREVWLVTESFEPTSEERLKLINSEKELHLFTFGGAEFWGGMSKDDLEIIEYGLSLAFHSSATTPYIQPDGEQKEKFNKLLDTYRKGAEEFLIYKEMVQGKRND
jgi:hypothetical protein